MAILNEIFHRDERKNNLLTVAVFSVMGVPPKFLPDLGRITVPSGGKINEISVISIITDKSSERNIHVQFVSFISIADETKNV